MDEKALKDALAEYDKIRNSAWFEHDKICNSALVEYNKICNSAWSEYNKICNSARSEYEKIRDSAWSEYEKIRDSAWLDIKNKVDDPLVSWIIDNCPKYQGEALRVLSLLPATLSELDEFAKANDWCLTWQEFRKEALVAGVIKDL